MIRVLILVAMLLFAQPAWAFWIWTPETNKWTNPKYAVKETPAAQLAYALEYYEGKKYDEAVREFKKLIKHYPKSRQAPDAQFYIAKVLEDRGQLFASFKAYQAVVDKYPFSERSGEIVQRQYDLALAVLEGQGNKGFLANTFTDDYNVIEIFRTVIKNAPYGKLAPVAQYKIGLYLMEKGLYLEARDEFEKVINDYPESEWAKAAKFQVAQADAERSSQAPYDQKVTKAAVEQFENFLDNNPDAKLSEKAKEQISQLREKEAENSFLVAQFYEKQKNFKAAKIYYQAVVDDYASSSWAKKALPKIQELSGKGEE